MTWFALDLGADKTVRSGESTVALLLGLGPFRIVPGLELKVVQMRAVRRQHADAELPTEVVLCDLQQERIPTSVQFRIELI